MTQKIHRRFPAALAIAACLSFLCLCTAQAQPAAVWGGYTVIAQDDLDMLHAAVVKDPDTGALLLVIGETQNGAFTETARGEHAIPTDWDENQITVKLSAAEGRLIGSSVQVGVPAGEAENPDARNYVSFKLDDSGWTLRYICGKYADNTYFIVSEQSGDWIASMNDSVQCAELKAQAFDASLQTFDSGLALSVSAAAIREKYERQDVALQERLQVEFSGTPWADAALVDKHFHYTDGEIAVILTVLQIDGKEALCIFDKTDAGVWNAVMNTQIIAPETAAKSIPIEFSYDLNEIPGETGFSLTNHADPGNPEYVIVRDAQGVWKVCYYGYRQTTRNYWAANFNGEVMQLFAGGFVCEEGYIYRTIDPQTTLFETFDPERTKGKMFEFYVDYLYGEPPLIPDNGSAYTLPQPCGAELKQGTYAVYSGPGEQYYREDDGTAYITDHNWVQVFGTDGDWVLIQYRVDGPLLRFGYIPIDAMQNPDDVPRLAFESVYLASTENGFITSDPLGIGGKITLPNIGFPMTRLGTLGEYWMYVELILPNGQPARMFAEVDASHG